MKIWANVAKNTFLSSSNNNDNNNNNNNSNNNNNNNNSSNNYNNNNAQYLRKPSACDLLAVSLLNMETIK